MTERAECPVPGAQEPARAYALPRLVYVEWLRRARMQHSVGFLVSDTETHLVLADRFDGKHPDSRRLWTIDQGDVVIREEVRAVDPEVSAPGPRREVDIEHIRWQDQEAERKSRGQHVHEWGPLKAVPPDGDMGRECNICVTVQLERGRG